MHVLTKTVPVGVGFSSILWVLWLFRYDIFEVGYLSRNFLGLVLPICAEMHEIAVSRQHSCGEGYSLG
jgi:hypothetical protein